MSNLLEKAIQHRFPQGSHEWIAYRIVKNNASEAASAAGIATADKSREQLMHERYTGEPEQITNMQRRIFEAGHRFEALARPLGERLIGEDLIPEVWSLGNLSASYDGVTIGGNITWEHKQLNQEFEAIFTELYGDFRSINWNMEELMTCAILPEKTRLQIAQQQLIVGAESTLFTASKWSDNNELECIAHCWVMPDPELQQRVIDVWNRFELDFAAYAPHARKIALVAKPGEYLPALRARELLADSIAQAQEFQTLLIKVTDALPERLITDQDFANGALHVKEMLQVSVTIELARKESLDNAGLAKLFNLYATIETKAKNSRLNASRQVEADKLARKNELKAIAKAALSQFINALPHADLIRVEFDCEADAAIHGKSSVESMQSALNALVANTKMMTEKLSARIGKALAIIDTCGQPALFADRAALCLRELDFLQITVESRVNKHKEELEQAVKSARAQEFERDIPWPAPFLAGVNADKLAANLSIGEISKAIGISVSAELLQSLGCKIENRAAEKIVTSSLAGVAMRLKDHIDASVASYVRGQS